jgi:anti-sigma regulatory factor (Ser/Thr protein kinase)
MAALGAMPKERHHARPADGGHQVTLHSVRPVRDDPPVRPLPPPAHPDIELAVGWPLQDFFELGALPGAVPCARLHTRLLLWEWQLGSLGESVEMAVSELLTNAVAASWAREFIHPVRLWLLSDAARVLVLVWDKNPLGPLRTDIGEEAESGRGLLLVEAMCSRWDWYATPQLAGKAVWALCER